MITIRWNGGVLDTDDRTQLALSYESGAFVRNKFEVAHSLSMSVPATRKNNDIFMYDEQPNFDGMRYSADGEVLSGGVCLRGKLYLQRYSDGRYELLFMYGDLADIAGIFTTNIGLYAIYPDSIYIDGKMMATVSGTIPNFGFYNYQNGIFNGTVVDVPLTLLPSANLGYLIDVAAAAAGYTVTVPNAANLNSHSFGLVLPAANTFDEDTVTIDGSPISGWTVTTGSGNPLSQLGLQIANHNFHSGLFNQNHNNVYIFRATKEITIEYDAQGISFYNFVSGQGYNWGQGISMWYMGNRTIHMNAGDYFSVVAETDREFSLLRGWYWDGYNSFTAHCHLTFTVKNEEHVAGVGDTLTLQDNLPEMSLSQLLQAYCDLIGGICVVDSVNKTIQVMTLRQIFNRGDAYTINHKSMTDKLQIERYVDGLAQTNRVRCKSADYVNETNYFIREFTCNNDCLQEEQEWAVVPWNEGNWNAQNGHKYVVLQDIIVQEDNSLTNQGKLSIIYQNTIDSNGALHVQTINDEGVGSDMSTVAEEAYTVYVQVKMALFEFAAIRPWQVVMYDGRRYLVKQATWSDGICDMTLLYSSINSTVKPNLYVVP